MSKLKEAMNKGTESARAMTAYERFRAQLNLVRVDVAGLVGERNVDKFVRVCLNAVQANPAVLGTDPRTRKSLLLACMKAAQDALLPDGREAVFNVYRTKFKNGAIEEWVDVVQYLPMAYGLIQKIYEAGATYVDAVPVYKEDDFGYQRGDEPKIVHKPYDGDGDPGPVKAAYCIVKLKTGETKREVMWRREIERVREKSKAKDGLMWKEFYDQAAVKSVIHRIVKQLPRSTSLEVALAHDNEAVGLEDVPTVPADQTGTNLEALIEMRFDAKEAAKEPPKDAGAAAPESPPPKKGDAGTPEMKKKIVDGINGARDVDTLGIKRDEANFFQWNAEDLAEVDAAYEARKKALGVK